MILLREQLARLLQKQHRGSIESWEDTTEFRQSQYLEKADEIIELINNAIYTPTITHIPFCQVINEDNK